MGQRPGRNIAILLALAGFGLVLIYAGTRLGRQTPTLPDAEQAEAPDTRVSAASQATATPSPPATPEPTATASAVPPAPAATATEPPAAIPVPPTRALSEAGELPLTYHDRFGVTGKPEAVFVAAEAGLPFGSFSTWLTHYQPTVPPGTFLWQMIRVSEEGPLHSHDRILAAIDSSPGSTWIIGNEPDVIHQDNVTPQRYAEIYHDLYVTIKQRDPSALVAIGAVTQPTPLRRAYLDAVLDTYEELYGAPMPVDVWNVHAFVLREERGGWGVDIPPGMDDGLATQYEIEDHLDMGIFRQLILEFRAWMAARGYGDRPLLVSEYGFLMPYEYGFDPAQVSDYMIATFDFFLEARGPTGYPADDNRLVQWWLWFVLDDDSGEWSGSYLINRQEQTLTALGETYASYVRSHEP
jgi:hypothetical protein